MEWFILLMVWGIILIIIFRWFTKGKNNSESTKDNKKWNKKENPSEKGKENIEDALSYEIKAWLKQSIKDYEGAIKDYNKAIELDPNSNTAYFLRWMTKFTVLKQEKEGEKDIQKAAELWNNDAIGWINMYRMRKELK